MNKYLLALNLFFVYGMCYAQFSEVQQKVYAPDIMEITITTDLNRDGKVDILGFKENDWLLGWYENIAHTPTILYHPIEVDLSEGINHYHMDIGAISTLDIDNDEDLDILIAKLTLYTDTVHYSYGDSLIYKYKHTLAWLENDGNQKFSELKIIDEQSSNEIKIADLDGDGFQDFITASTSENSIKWYRNKGTGGFHPPILIDGFAKNVSDIDIADFDLDGDIDIVSGLAFEGNRIMWFENDGAGNFGSPITIASYVNSVYDIAVADFDSDNLIDVVSLSKGDKKIAWYRNTPNDGFESEKLIGYYTEAWKNYKLEVIDLDQDNDNDIFSCNGEGLNYILAKNDGEGNFTFQQNNDKEPYLSKFNLLVDWDTDGHIDIFGINQYTDKINWRKNKGDGDFFDYEPLSSSLRSAKDFVIVDITNDEKEDVIIWSSTNIMYLHGEEGKEYSEIYLIERDLNRINNLFISDLDHDEDNDILITQVGYCSLYWLENKGDGTFHPQKTIGCINQFSTEPSTVVIGDIDKDGLSDIYYANFTSNQQAWYRNEGDGHFSDAIQLFPDDIDITQAFLEDYDKDNDLDLLLLHYMNQTAAWYQNDGMGNFEWVENITTTLNKETINSAQLVDVDNDGTKDLFTISGWYRKIDSYNYHHYPIKFAPNTNSSTIIGDINSDGYVDILTHESSYTKPKRWYLNNKYGQLGLQFVEQYINIKGKLIDVNGDGLLDLMGINEGLVWHENTGDFSDIITHYQINGKQFFDQNKDGKFNEGELGLRLNTLHLSPIAQEVTTFENGNFFFVVPEGIYQLSPVENALWELTSNPAVFDIHTSEGDLSQLSFDFGFKPTRILPRVEPHLNSSPIRCNREATYWLTYSNTGTTIGNGTITLEVDELMEFITSNPEPDAIEGQTLIWYFSELYPTYENKIQLQFQIPDFNSMGEILETQASIQLFNENQELTYSKSIQYDSEVLCSYDPNDKLTRSNLLGQSEFAYIEDTIFYTIRFQNTGNDVAFNVRIEDALDKKLDLTTFHPITASHDYRTELNRETGLVTFYFDDIMLPDSTTNEEESHGFVMFGIASLKGIADKTELDNTASIFFDFNPAIITNTATLTLIEQVETDIEAFHSDYSIRVSPNPFSDYTTIEVGGLLEGNYQLQLMDILGRNVRELDLKERKASLERGDLESGLYLMRVLEKNSNRILGNAKVMINR